MTTTDGVESHGGHGIKRFVNRIRGGSLGLKSRQNSQDTLTDGNESNHKSTKNKHLSRDADISLQLWNSAYDALRDDPVTAALVVTYESIISQELPDHLKVGGMNISFRGKSDTQRLELLTEITQAGLDKRRGSKISQVEEAARTVVENSKEVVASIMAIYPSSAVAWTGICTLTPLLLDPILRLEHMRSGVLHVTGRISWYMSLSWLLLEDSWQSKDDFKNHHGDANDHIGRLYRRVLEFEMNCICASASTWNAAAKSVVNWSGLNTMVERLTAADAEMTAYIAQYATDDIQRSRFRCNTDLDLQGATHTLSKEETITPATAAS